MNNKPELNEQEEWEMRVQKISREFEFPVTPNLAKQVQRQLNPAPRPLMRGVLSGLFLYFCWRLWLLFRKSALVFWDF
jgi:hypothetical protein